MKKISFLTILTLLSIAGVSQSKSKDTFTIGGSYQDGNNKQYSIITQLNLFNDSSKLRWDINPSYSFIESSDAKNNWIRKADEKNVSGTLSYKWDGMKFIAMGEAEQSYIKKIDIRYSLGAGMSFNVINKKNINLTFSEAIMPERYVSSTNTLMNLTSVSASSRIKFVWNSGVKVSMVVLAQPSIWSQSGVSGANNFDMQGNLKFEIPLYKKLSLSLINIFNESTYATYVNPSVKPIDYTTSIAITIKNF